MGRLMLAGMSLVLVACAAAPERPGSDVAPVASDLDLEKMALIERQARATGVSVHWINPPQRMRRGGS